VPCRSCRPGCNPGSPAPHRPAPAPQAAPPKLLLLPTSSAWAAFKREALYASPEAPPPEDVQWRLLQDLAALHTSYDDASLRTLAEAGGAGTTLATSLATGPPPLEAAEAAEAACENKVRRPSWPAGRGCGGRAASAPGTAHPALAAPSAAPAAPAGASDPPALPPRPRS
jgi:hypothetical protein